MADDTREIKAEAVESALGDIKLEEHAVKGRSTSVNGHSRSATPADIKRSKSTTPAPLKSESQSPVKKERSSQTPLSDDEQEEVVGGDITVTVEPGKAPKLSRKSSQKIITRPAPLFDHLEDTTEEATSVFQVIKDCIYGSKYMGYSEHDALDCDCVEEWNKNDSKNYACGEDSDCINRATKMECIDGDCNCGRRCQNQRFQRKQYANVSVIKTEKKGYGLRVNTDLQPNDFIFEYIGEVINEPTFRRRTIQYDEEGIKHFYFMSLTKSEFVDATKKGNLGRFCNHSCNPNCYVDKWVVGEKLRMGIFAERHIKAGEELVFNYNVDRYGADPQPCYCGEPNCTGYIGGKTQTERATKLSHATIEALGIDDGDGWDTAVAKRPRKKKAGEDDEEYVNNVQPKGLDEEGVRKVMASLMQCKEKWIVVKLLSRIQRCGDDRVRNRVVQMHGYQILRTTLTTWKEDNNVVLQVLDILYNFPRLTKNKINDSKIEATIQTLVDSEHEDVAFESKRLIEEWAKLEIAYRIPRKKFDPNAQTIFERREPERVEEVIRSPAPSVHAPTGPRSNIPQRTPSYVPRPPIRRPFHTLPSGWFTAQDQNGNTYYYSKSGSTTWQRPTFPAVEPPPPPPRGPPKSVQTQKALQDIIDSITKADPNALTPSHSTKSAEATPKDRKKPVEKWRAYSQEKQMKLYENTLSPHIKTIMSRYTHKLPKDDLKKFAKEVGKKLVASDFKNNRVEDPSKISEKQERKVKKYVKEFFERAVEKKKGIEERKKVKEAEKAKRRTNGHGHGYGRGDGDGDVKEGKANGASALLKTMNGTPSRLDPHTPTSSDLPEADISDAEPDPEQVSDNEADEPSPSLPATPSLTQSMSFSANASAKRKFDRLLDSPGNLGSERGDGGERDERGGGKRVRALADGDGDGDGDGDAEGDRDAEGMGEEMTEISPPPPPPPPPMGMDDSMGDSLGEDVHPPFETGSRMGFDGQDDAIMTHPDLSTNGSPSYRDTHTESRENGIESGRIDIEEVAEEMAEETEEAKELRKQEEDLMRENEEAERAEREDREDREDREGREEARRRNIVAVVGNGGVEIDAGVGVGNGDEEDIRDEESKGEGKSIEGMEGIDTLQHQRRREGGLVH